MKPYIDVRLRISITPSAVSGFASPMEVAEHAAQCICSNSDYCSAAVLPEEFVLLKLNPESAKDFLAIGAALQAMTDDPV